MLKDNHIDFAGGITKAIEKTKRYLKETEPCSPRRPWRWARRRWPARPTPTPGRPPPRLDLDAVTTSAAATDDRCRRLVLPARLERPRPTPWSAPTGAGRDPEPLGGGGYQSRPVFAASPDGAVTAVWTESRARRKEGRVLSSTFADGSWSVPTQVWQGRDAMFPAVAANAAGDMVVAWTAARPGSFGLSGTRAPSYAVRAKLRPAGGDWVPPPGSTTAAASCGRRPASASTTRAAHSSPGRRRSPAPTGCGCAASTAAPGRPPPGWRRSGSARSM